MQDLENKLSYDWVIKAARFFRRDDYKLKTDRLDDVISDDDLKQKFLAVQNSSRTLKFWHRTLAFTGLLNTLNLSTLLFVRNEKAFNSLNDISHKIFNASLPEYYEASLIVLSVLGAYSIAYGLVVNSRKEDALMDYSEKKDYIIYIGE